MMDSRKCSVRSKGSVFSRLGGGGGGGGGQYVRKQVCVYWLQGRCNRNPCRYLHSESPIPQPNQSQAELASAGQAKQSQKVSSCHNHFKSTWRNPNYYRPKKEVVSTTGAKDDQGTQRIVSVTVAKDVEENEINMVTTKEAVEYKSSKEVHHKPCQFLFNGSGFSRLTTLVGHTEAITGISLPSGSHNLYTGSKDGCVRAWDCNTGQCAGVLKLDCEARCLINEGPWVFVGMQNAVKAWNIQTQDEINVRDLFGLVCTMVVDANMLFVAVQGGTILVLRFISKVHHELVATLNGHSEDVISMVIGDKRKRLYSGSKDGTIGVWDVESFQCLEILHAHSSAVTSVLGWNDFMLSGSLDNTLKVWGLSESGNLEVVYQRKEESGIVALCSIQDAGMKPSLLCSCQENSVRVYDLPSFVERGRLYAIHSIAVVCGALFFTGEEKGEVSVWRLDGEPSSDFPPPE